MERSTKDVLRDNLLCSLYAKAAKTRSGRLVPKPEVSQVQRVSDRLGDHRLCELFVEAQFARFPADWCRPKFKRPYPPATMVFGEGSIEAYEAYVEQGFRTPIIRR